METAGTKASQQGRAVLSCTHLLASAGTVVAQADEALLFAQARLRQGLRASR